MDRRRPLRRRAPAVAAALAAFVAAGFATATATQAPASPSPEFRLAGDSVHIPVQIRGNLIYVRGRIGDSDSLWIVLDSGAGSSVIDDDRARELRLDVRDGGEAHGAGGTTSAGRVSDVTIAIPGLTIEHASLTAIPLGNLAGSAGRRIDVILGEPLLRRFVVRIDYERAELTIVDPARFQAPAGAASLPLRYQGNLPYVTARVTLPGQPAAEGRFVIDTGSANSIILGAPFVREHHALDAVGKTIETRGNGVGGQSQNRLGRVDSLELAGFGLSRPTATLRVSDTGVIAAKGAIGNIGGDVLRRFTVTFDYSRDRMYLEPNAHLGDPFEADMAGIGMQMNLGTHRLDVTWIQADSPASESGIQTGDAIELVDGATPESLDMPRLRAMFRRPGETHQLQVRRGTETRQIAITTRRLI